MCVYIYIIFYKLEFWKVIGTHHGNTALSLGGCCLERPVIYLYDMRVHMPCTVYVYSSISNKCNIFTWQSHMPTMTSDCLSLSQTVCQEGYPRPQLCAFWLCPLSIPCMDGIFAWGENCQNVKATDGHCEGQSTPFSSGWWFQRLWKILVN